MTYRFAWRCSEGKNTIMDCSTLDESQAWVWALERCGFAQRTSLGLLGSDGYVRKNWWDAMDEPSLHKFNQLYLSFNLQDRIKSGYFKVTSTS